MGSNDLHQRAEIGIALVGNDSRVINSKMDKIFNMADSMGQGRIIDSSMEIFTV